MSHIPKFHQELQPPFQEWVENREWTTHICLTQAPVIILRHWKMACLRIHHLQLQLHSHSTSTGHRWLHLSQVQRSGNVFVLYPVSYVLMLQVCFSQIIVNRHSPAGSAYHQGQPSNIVSPAPTSNSGVVRNSSVTPDPLRGVPR